MRLGAISALLVFHLALHGLWRLFRAHSPWPRHFLRRAAWASGVTVGVAGAPLRRDVLLVANHLSWLDILIIAGVSSSRFVAKHEVDGWPAIGWLAGLHDTVYVARAARGDAHRQADRLRAALAEQVPVTLFPEGATGDGHGVKPFRASLLAALVPPLPGLRLQPVALDYGDEAPLIAWPDTHDAGTEAMRILSLPGRRHVTVHFLPPVDPAVMPDRKALAAAAREAIRVALGESAPAAV